MLLEQCKARGWLKARGRQRTDSTYVLAAVRALNCVECVGETLRHTLNVLAGVAPDWLRATSEAWICLDLSDDDPPHAASPRPLVTA